MLGMTVGELGERMSSAEFTRWIAFEREYGIPDLFFLAAQICRAIFFAFTGKSPAAGDLVPYFEPPLRPQPVAEQRAIVRAHLDAARRKRMDRV